MKRWRTRVRFFWKGKSMNLKTGFLSRLVKREDGLVTVEWVALAAAMVVGAVTVGWLVLGNLGGPANKIGSQLNSVATSPLPAPPS
jgi:Flp pilus assembly pilin Flp